MTEVWSKRRILPLIFTVKSFGKISAQPNTTLFIQFLDRENN